MIETLVLPARFTRMRIFAGVVGALLIGVSLYLLAALLDRAFAVVVGTSAVVAGLVGVVASRTGFGRRVIGLARNVELVSAIVAFAVPVLLNVFVRLNYERYIWVIEQPGICGSMGSGALLFAAALISWPFAFGALGLLVATRRGGERLFPRAGLYAGGILLIIGVFLVVGDPQPFANLLGCSR